MSDASRDERIANLESSRRIYFNLIKVKWNALKSSVILSF